MVAEIVNDRSLPAIYQVPSKAVSKLLAFAAAFAALQFYFASRIGLSNDEAYYRLWSMHPALSYFDHPPMVAWMIAASRTIVGDSVLGIRAGAIVLYFVTGVFFFRLTDILYGRDTAVTATWLALAMPFLAVGGIVASPDIPSVLFWVLTFWAVAEFSRSKNPRWWLAVGLFAGCGLISKYTNLFAGASILIWLFTVPGNAKAMRSPYFWLGGLIAAALTLPVMVWNYEHHWASFAMQFGRVTSGGGGRFGQFEIELLATFLGLASPVIALLAMGGLTDATRAAVLQRRSPDVLIAAVMLPMVAYFLVHALHTRVHFNWMAPIYPFFAICAARALQLQVPPHRMRGVFFWAVGIGFGATVMIFAHALKPLSNSMKWDALGETRGWKGFADAVDRVRLNEHADWVATSTFATGAQLTFELRQRVHVQQINEAIRYVDMDQNQIPATPAIYVERGGHSDAGLLRRQFNSVRQLGSISRTDGSLHGMSYDVYLVADPRTLTPQR